jgi:hypothetical protein
MKFYDLFKKNGKVTEIARDNPFRGIMTGLRSSIEKLPGPMVVIMVLALSIAIMLGIAMKISVALNKDAEFLPLRISIDADKPAINPAHLRGTWLYDDNVQSMSLRFGVDVFEITQMRKGEKYVRYYVRGGYRTEGNVLILQIREDLGAPFEPTRMELRFIPLEFDKLNVRVELTDKIMLWRIPSSERAKFDPSLQDEFPLTDKHPMAFVRLTRQ